LRQYWVAPLPPFNVVDGNLNTFTTKADALLPGVTLPANILEVGSTLRLSAFGNWSSTGSPTFLTGFYYGAVAGIALAETAAITVGAAAASWPWHMEWEGRVRTVGTSGSIVGQGFIDAGAASLTAITRSAIPLTLALRTVTIDTTVAKAITVGCTCSASSSSNIFITNQLLVELAT
jgi:hypothetical protein